MNDTIGSLTTIFGIPNANTIRGYDQRGLNTIVIVTIIVRLHVDLLDFKTTFEDIGTASTWCGKNLVPCELTSTNLFNIQVVYLISLLSKNCNSCVQSCGT